MTAPQIEMNLEAGTLALCSACFKVRKAMAALGASSDPEPLCHPCPFAEQYRAIATQVKPWHEDFLSRSGGPTPA